jgi:hypothetical protein
MVKDLHDGDETDASFYAGLLVSAYAVAEAMTAMGWGALSDRYGRKPIVLIGLGGVAISSLVFGLAKSYWVALLARFIGGALNGNVAVMQTMVAEMVKKPEHERKFCHQGGKKFSRRVESANTPYSQGIRRATLCLDSWRYFRICYGWILGSAYPLLSWSLCPWKLLGGIPVSSAQLGRCRYHRLGHHPGSILLGGDQP